MCALTIEGPDYLYPHAPHAWNLHGALPAQGEPNAYKSGNSSAAIGDKRSGIPALIRRTCGVQSISSCAAVGRKQSIARFDAHA
jgi:hypothetical protein